MLRGEDQKLKTWQLRCGVPPRAAACAEKQNAPALYRRGRARRTILKKISYSRETGGADKVACGGLQAQRLLDCDRDLAVADCLDKRLEV